MASLDEEGDNAIGQKAGGLARFVHGKALGFVDQCLESASGDFQKQTELVLFWIVCELAHACSTGGKRSYEEEANEADEKKHVKKLNKRRAKADSDDDIPFFMQDASIKAAMRERAEEDLGRACSRKKNKASSTLVSTLVQTKVDHALVPGSQSKGTWRVSDQVAMIPPHLLGLSGSLLRRRMCGRFAVVRAFRGANQSSEIERALASDAGGTGGDRMTRLFTATSACASIPGGLDKASLASPGFDLRRLRRWGIPARTTVNVIPTDDLAVDYLAEQVRGSVAVASLLSDPTHTRSYEVSESARTTTWALAVLPAATGWINGV
ncbi:unnamed protein product [Symbiodinium microadriaticum]|nr:unnamed protein product [Symbiodinium microadriaticum]